MRFIVIGLAVLLAAASTHAADVEVNGKKIKINVCGGIAGLQCAADQWCDYPEESVCGVADYLGVCRPRPENCMQVYIPVCGCDGKNHSNSCVAMMGGTDVAYEGTCAAKK